MTVLFTAPGQSTCKGGRAAPWAHQFSQWPLHREIIQCCFRPSLPLFILWACTTSEGEEISPCSVLSDWFFLAFVLKRPPWVPSRPYPAWSLLTTGRSMCSEFWPHDGAAPQGMKSSNQRLDCISMRWLSIKHLLCANHCGCWGEGFSYLLMLS